MSPLVKVNRLKMSHFGNRVYLGNTHNNFTLARSFACLLSLMGMSFCSDFDRC